MRKQKLSRGGSAANMSKGPLANEKKIENKPMRKLLLTGIAALFLATELEIKVKRHRERGEEGHLSRMMA